MSEETAPGPGAPAASRLREWFLRDGAQKAARSREFPAASRAALALERAMTFAEAGAALTSIRPRLEGEASPVGAMELTLRAAEWALVAHLVASGQTEEPSTVALLWERIEGIDGGPLATVDAAALASARTSSTSSRDRLADLEPAARQVELAHLRTVVAALIAPLEERATARSRVASSSVLRILGVVAVTAILGTWGTLATMKALRGPNVALHKPVTMSSLMDGYQASAATDGITSELAVHSGNDKSPWLQVDLGAPTGIKRVVVYNRTDFGQDRATPMVVEVSMDGQSFAQMGRQDTEFRVWTAVLPSVTTRFVRIRIDRPSYLHINEVEIFQR